VRIGGFCVIFYFRGMLIRVGYSRFSHAHKIYGRHTNCIPAVTNRPLNFWTKLLMGILALIYVILISALGISWLIPSIRNKYYFERKISLIDRWFVFGTIFFEYLNILSIYKLVQNDYLPLFYDMLFIGIFNLLVYSQLLPRWRLLVLVVLISLYLTLSWLGYSFINWNYILLICGFSLLFMDRLLKDQRPTMDSFTYLNYSVDFLLIFIVTLFSNAAVNWNESNYLKYFNYYFFIFYYFNLAFIYVKSSRPIFTR
jgi:hypothetical protein